MAPGPLPTLVGPPIRTAHLPLSSTASMALLHVCTLDAFGVTSLKGCQQSPCFCNFKLPFPCSDSEFWEKALSVSAFFFVEPFFFALPVDLNSHFRSFQGHGGPLLSFFSSSYCYIPVFEHQVSETLFLCCSPLPIFLEVYLY